MEGSVVRHGRLRMAQHHHASDGDEHGSGDDTDAQQNGDGYFESLVFFTGWLPAGFCGGSVFARRLGHGGQSFPVRLE